jgi:hypothetical protein
MRQARKSGFVGLAVFPDIGFPMVTVSDRTLLDYGEDAVYLGQIASYGRPSSTRASEVPDILIFYRHITSESIREPVGAIFATGYALAGAARQGIGLCWDDCAPRHRFPHPKGL